ncbi:MAG: lytic transglycosylase domain-containing protein [Thermodesulfobacteriota bacterium]
MKNWSRYLFCVCSAYLMLGMPGDVSAEIYMRIGKDGHKEFTNRPSDPGWVFYMSESQGEPVIQFVSVQGKPKSVDEIIGEISRKFDIDSALVKAIVTVESNCDPNAVSKKGAQGLMQLMPSTSKKLKVDKPFDPRENIVGGVKYIKGLLASYGDLRLALAAYNAGPAAVKKHDGIPPYRETINYVKKVIENYKRFKKGEPVNVAGSKAVRKQARVVPVKSKARAAKPAGKEALARK